VDGRKTGAFGHVNTFSFFYSHQVSTMEGGMVLTGDDELMDLLRSLRAHGWTRDLPPESPLFKASGDVFEEAYHFILPGYNVRPLEFSGAIGREQLKKLPRMTQRRRENLAHFRRLFDGDRRFIIQRENCRSSSFAFTIILNPQFNIDRESVFEALRQADVGFRMITGGCFPCHDAVRFFDFKIAGAVENAELAHRRGFVLGNYPSDLAPQLDTVRKLLDRVCRV
jgi:CDP-6-deoxy-D-xylo-4-hexulose-3-dehydrase